MKKADQKAGLEIFPTLQRCLFNTAAAWPASADQL